MTLTIFCLHSAYIVHALAPARYKGYHQRLVDDTVRDFEGARWQVLQKIALSQFFQEYTVFHALAKSLIEKGDISKALQALRMAEDRIGETDPLYHSWRVEKLLELSETYRSIGKEDRAFSLFNQARDILDKHPEISAYSRLKHWTSLGRFYGDAGRIEESKRMFTRAISVSREISDVPLRVKTLFEAVAVLNDSGEDALSQRFFTEAREAIDTVESVFHRCTLLCDSAEIQADLGKRREARADLAMAQTISNQPQMFSFYRTEMKGRIMEVYQAWGEDRPAMESYLDALEEAGSVTLTPENDQARLSLAKVTVSRGAYLFVTDDREMGRRYFERAMELAGSLEREGDRQEVFTYILERISRAGAFMEASAYLEEALHDINIQGYPVDPDNTILPTLVSIFEHLGPGRLASLASRIKVPLIRIMALSHSAERIFQKNPERAWKLFAQAFETAGILEKQAEKPAAHAIIVERMARAGVFDEVNRDRFNALLHWWELGIENEAYFTAFMKRFDPQNPIPAYREALSKVRLTRIEMSESGNAFQNCQGPARNLVREAVARGTVPEMPPGNPPLPALTAEGKTLSSIEGLLEGYRLEKVMGRTAVYRSERDGSLRALKFLLREEDPELLVRENRWMEYLAQNRERLGLRGYYPRPLRDGEARYFETPSLPEQVEIGLAAQKKKNGEPFVLAQTRGRFRFIAYDVTNPDYFRYVNETGVDRKRMLESMRLNLHDLGVLARFGIIHTSLIELFHNEEPHRQAHPDGGRYIWIVDLVRPMLREGAGRIHAYPDAVRYPNYRLSGPADFAEIALLAEMLRNEHPKSRHLDNNLRRFSTSERTLFTRMAFSGDILLSAALVYGLARREENRWRWDDEISLAETARELESLFEAFIRGYLGGDAGFVSPLPSIDWVKMARQMAFFMGKGEPYAEYMQNRDIPEIIFGPGVRVEYPRDLSGVRNWVDSVKRKGFFSNGEHPDLGVMNGPNPLQELIRALYLTTANLVTSGKKASSRSGGIKEAGPVAKMFGRAA